MSNNSYPCAAGGEIGRAQVVQAEACGLEPHPDMNPILLKPESDRGSQVVVNGKVWRNLEAVEYYSHFDWLRAQVLEAYERLAAKYEYIVIEGAGSIAELNLKSRDLVNLPLAKEVGAPVLLVADIERGGVFACVVGTFCLLDDSERKLVRSFAVNRFRGDMSLFEDGVEILTSKTGKPCLGVFPMLQDAEIDAEDGVAFDERSAGNSDIAILQFPRISNLTDFRLLSDADRITKPSNRLYRCVILPGTKSTIADLHWMRTRGLDAWVKRQHAAGALIVGICGGFQMLGEAIYEPDALDGSGTSAVGLSLVSAHTVMQAEKTTQVVDAVLPLGAVFQAYEIHMGQTTIADDVTPFAFVDGRPEGIRTNGCVGTYLHGALESPAVLKDLLGIKISPRASREQNYDRLSEWFESHCDTRLFEELYL
jgi:adenosylcobyric acid synthase